MATCLLKALSEAPKSCLQECGGCSLCPVTGQAGGGDGPTPVSAGRPGRRVSGTDDTRQPSIAVQPSSTLARQVTRCQGSYAPSFQVNGEMC